MNLAPAFDLLQAISSTKSWLHPISVCCIHACTLRLFSIIQLLIRRLFFFSAYVVNKQRRYEFLLGNFLFPSKSFPIGISDFFPSLFLLHFLKELPCTNVEIRALACSDHVPEKLKAEDALRERNSCRDWEGQKM